MIQSMYLSYFYIIGSLDHNISSYMRNVSLEYIYGSKVDTWKFSHWEGGSDIGDNVMMITLWWWQFENVKI